MIEVLKIIGELLLTIIWVVWCVLAAVAGAAETSRTRYRLMLEEYNQPAPAKSAGENQQEG